MTAGNQSRQRESFNQLVADGVYEADFDHPPKAQAFVAQILADHLMPGLAGTGATYLDAGCGTGAWLAYVQSVTAQQGIAPRFMGFDLSDGMVDLARNRLGAFAEGADLRTGDASDPAAYTFPGTETGIDRIFAYDLVQQLPVSQQFSVCEIIAKRLAPGGVAAIFDHDKDSDYGRTMGRKKFLTQFFFLPLVPRYYCNAKYPPLAKFAEKIAAQDGMSAEIVPDANGKKRALILRRAG
ncbi:MAG: class I SAM-dependent methyltransferase [Magnetospiraceae bacterium]